MKKLWNKELIIETHKYHRKHSKKNLSLNYINAHIENDDLREIISDLLDMLTKDMSEDDAIMFRLEHYVDKVKEAEDKAILLLRYIDPRINKYARKDPDAKGWLEDAIRKYDL